MGELSIDLNERTARAGDRVLTLTEIEFDLLAYLAARPGHAFSSGELANAVRHSSKGPVSESEVAALVRRLRTKIERDPRRPLLLTTARGTGYRLGTSPQGDTRRRSPTRNDVGSVIHVDGDIVAADRAAGLILGFDNGDALLGRPLAGFAAQPTEQAVREHMVSVPTGRERHTQLIDLERADGSAVTVEAAFEGTDWNGQSASLVSLTPAPDLSARLRRLVTGVLSDVTDAVIITDLHFHLHSWNKAAERLYGWREEEVLGRHVLDVLRWADDEGALEEIWGRLDVSGRWKGQSRQVTRDGSVISVLATTTMVLDETDEPFLIVSVNRPAPTIHDPFERHADDDEIRRGIANDEFEVYYQPVVTLDGLQVMSMEALLRWNHPDRGLLGPAAIIATAEMHGSIIDLGHVVLDKACAQAAQWRRDGHDVDMSVNLSARQLSDPDLFDRITDVLTSHALDPHRLWLEVTETALVDEVERAREVLERLAEMGVRFAIDDFGTGWASLTYLRSFPIHELKIDRSFVAGVGRNANDTAIARSILALGAELNLLVIAEGIETEAQHKALQRLGCRLGQGYLFGRPTPAAAAPIVRAGRVVPV
ncbi:hypothetical protein BH10ACT3_BH10ACT3_17910 [soil metagenome]